jgi:hypothetical protein
MPLLFQRAFVACKKGETYLNSLHLYLKSTWSSPVCSETDTPTRNKTAGCRSQSSTEHTRFVSCHSSCGNVLQFVRVTRSDGYAQMCMCNISDGLRRHGAPRAWRAFGTSGLHLPLDVLARTDKSPMTLFSFVCPPIWCRRINCCVRFTAKR